MAQRRYYCSDGFCGGLDCATCYGPGDDGDGCEDCGADDRDVDCVCPTCEECGARPGECECPEEILCTACEDRAATQEVTDEKWSTTERECDVCANETAKRNALFRKQQAAEAAKEKSDD